MSVTFAAAPTALTVNTVDLADMRHYHNLHSPEIRKGFTEAQLHDIVRDMNIPYWRRCVYRSDYVRSITQYAKTEVYQAIEAQYARHLRRVKRNYRHFDEVPEPMRTREMRLLTGRYNLYDDVDKTFVKSVKAAKYPPFIPHIPMSRFTRRQRYQIIEAATSLEILAYVPVDEVIVWLERWPLALKYIPHGQQTWLLCQTCVARSGWALEHCSPALLDDHLEDLAVSSAPRAIQWVRKERRGRLAEKVLRRDPWVIECIEQVPGYRLLALLTDWKCYCILKAPLSPLEQSVVKQGEERDRQVKAAPADVIMIDA